MHSRRAGCGISARTVPRGLAGLLEEKNVTISRGNRSGRQSRTGHYATFRQIATQANPPIQNQASERGEATRRRLPHTGLTKQPAPSFRLALTNSASNNAESTSTSRTEVGAIGKNSKPRLALFESSPIPHAIGECP
jgi:hypothetical protein